MLKNLKSLFIIEEEGEKSNKSGGKKTTPKKKGSGNTIVKVDKAKPVIAPTSVVTRDGQINQKMFDSLLAALEKNNIDGFDYFEFKQSLKSLEKMPMDEATRYKSAFAMASTMGAKPDYIIKSASHYLQVLDKELSSFNTTVEKQRQSKIGAQESNIKKLNELIQSKSKQIKELTQEIEKHQKQMTQIQNSIKDAAGKIDLTQKDYAITYDNLVGQIKEDVENMNKYLK